MQRLLANWMMKVVRRPGFWLVVALVALITIPHYGEGLEHFGPLTNLTANLGMDRHAFERVLYLLPIILAGFLFGWRGGVVTSIVALACMLPRAIFISPFPRDALFETGAVFVVGNLTAFSFGFMHKERERRIQLAALDQISKAVSQSLELGQVLSTSIDNVVDVMKVDAALIFLLDEEAGELALTAHGGVSRQFAQGVGKLKLGEGLNGLVAQTGEPVFVQDTSKDQRLTKMAVREEGIRSQLIVPLKSKGRVMGTICVAMRSYRRFPQDSVELLTAIGNQIGVAVDNARLYQQELELTEELRISEEKYRELFENAHDAIWVHDLQGNITLANRACGELSGYPVAELIGKNVSMFLMPEALALAREIKERLLRGEAIEQRYEQRLKRKDGSEASLQLATSPVFSGGELVAFQHIARDITEEKRMQENLRFYLKQATKSQEEERKRIARELHDETIQELVVLSRQVDDLAFSGLVLSEQNISRHIGLRQQINNVIQGVRRLSQDLRPAALDRLGLLAALEWLTSNVAEYSGIPIDLNVSGQEHRLSEEAELLLFRITQEALRNVWRHSEATRANVMVAFDQGKTIIAISDNGKGFAFSGSVDDLFRDGKLGLAGMHERARLLGGTVKVQSEPGKGTEVTVEIPNKMPRTA
jgi:PAS domain S-box-containing protein